MSVRYVRSEEVLSAEVADDVVALHPAQGDCYGLPGVSAEIWRHLAEPLSINELCRKLVTQFDIDDVHCREETTEFVRKLVDERLVLPVPDADY